MTEMPVQLLTYRFGPGSGFEGRIVGALERMESGGAMRILEVLFVGKLDGSDELSAVGLRSRGIGSLVPALIGFRLDGAERARATRKTLATEGLGDTVRALGAELAAGESIAAVLVEHTWAQAMNAAVESSGGVPVVSEFVAAASLGELAPLLSG